jgi:hypothetical protein
MRRITLILMHILMQPPSSYKISNGAETHDPSTHATGLTLDNHIDRHYDCPNFGT